jgi:hypothetical protein
MFAFGKRHKTGRSFPPRRARCERPKSTCVTDQVIREPQYLEIFEPGQLRNYITNSATDERQILEPSQARHLIGHLFSPKMSNSSRIVRASITHGLGQLQPFSNSMHLLAQTDPLTSDASAFKFLRVKIEVTAAPLLPPQAMLPLHVTVASAL